MQPDETIHIAVERGKITSHVGVPDLVIRRLQSDELPDYEMPDIDSPDYGEPDIDEIASQDEGYEYRLQGRIVNKTRGKLSAVKYDIAYYDHRGRFLGLDRSGLLDDDELDRDDFLAIDLQLTLPPETARCVFNCRALKPGLLGWLFWG